MNAKRILLVIFFSALLVGLVAGILRLSGGGEDTWLCVNGAWVRHGNPQATEPAAGCGADRVATTTIKVFFLNVKLDPEITCLKVFPVERTIEKTKAVGKAALEELFLGPTAEEAAQGYTTSLNPGVKLLSLTVASGTATADFSEELDKNIGGSCRVAAISAQIRETLKQFPAVKDVIISRNGRTEDVLQP